MDFKYENTVEHNGVLFYVAGGGSKAYFFCGGCLIAVSRPAAGEGEVCGEIAKFGLTLHGLPGNETFVANYVRTELCRRGMKRALPPEGGEMFIDAVDMLNHDAGCSERDLCGHKEVSVQDPILAEHIVSFCVASGLLITVARDLPDERVLHLLDVPVTINAYSGFVYEPNRYVLALTQARLTDLPHALISLVEGLFDGIPISRKALGEDDIYNPINVVVTSTRAAVTTTVMQRMGNKSRLHASATALKDVHQKDGKVVAGAVKKKAAISTFVQVKYIPRVVNIWRFKGENGAARPTKSLLHLWDVYCRADVVLSDDTECWEGLDPEFDASRERLSAAVEATFGKSSPPFIGGGLAKNVTPTQKFVILQYTQSRLCLPTCFPLLEYLCQSYATDQDAFPTPPPDEHALADSVNSMFRRATFAGAAAEAVLQNEFRGKGATEEDMPPNCESLVRDADLLLETAEDLTDAFFLIADYRENRITKLTRILDRLYRGEDITRLAASECKMMDNSDLLRSALDVVESSAFDDTDTGARMGIYISTLIALRLKEAGVPSFSP